MNRLLRSLARPRSAVVGICLLVGALVPVQIGLVVTRDDDAGPPPSSMAYDELLPPKPTTLPRAASPTPKPKPKPKPSPTRTTPAPKPTGPSLRMFGGLGAWVDVYDFAELDTSAAVATMRSNGVRTLYIQTGRHNTEHDVAPEVGPWLVAAHAAGMQVVGWYLPNYKKLTHDVDRTVAIATYRFEGQRFDALGIDIEYKNDVRHVPTWNERVVEHARRVRARLGSGYAIAAITPPPLQMDVAPVRWAGFPWRGLAEHSDLFVLMNYWSFRDCDERPEHCAYPYTAENVRETRRLVGPGRPIHVIGGVGDVISTEELADFVRAARAVDSYGASLYDFQTTKDEFWPVLAPLRSL